MKSNLKSIHNVSPLVASNGHKLPTDDLTYEGQTCWAYILHNIKNNMWYIGISTQHPDNYTTSSNNKHLMIAYSKGEIVRRIIKVGSSFEQMKKYESDLLKDTNAVKDSDSYNLSNGIVSKKVIREPNLTMMKDVADQTLRDKTLNGCKFELVNLTEQKKLKKDKGYFLENSFFKDIKRFQIRPEELDISHVNALSDKLDSSFGNLKIVEETTGQKFLVVVLRDRLMKGQEIDVIIGGNHTFKAIEQSKFCFEMPILNIPKSVHKEWTDEEIRGYGEYLNPVQGIKVLQSSEDGIIKTCLTFANQFGLDCNSITEHLKNHKLDNKQKTRIKANITSQYNKQKELQQQPKNFILYENSKDERIQNVLNDLKKEKYTYVSSISSGKLSVGDVVQKAVKEIKDGKKNLKKIKLLVYHPNQTAKNNFDTTWKPMIDSWHWAVDKEKIESITYEEMDWLKDEI